MLKPQWASPLLRIGYLMLNRRMCLVSGGPHAQSSATSSQELKTVENAPPKYQLGNPNQFFDFNDKFNELPEWKSELIDTMLIYPNFITEDEEKSLVKELEPYMSRLHYETSHWDDAIHDYRETERSKWNKSNEVIINRVRGLAFPPGVPQLKFVHILDLAKKGVIKPHVDSVRFCGNTIAGISLLSASVMRLRYEEQKDVFCDVLLDRFSLYIMKDFSRFKFTHEIMSEADSLFKSEKVPRDRRISVICRNEPTDSDSTNIFDNVEKFPPS